MRDKLHRLWPAWLCLTVVVIAARPIRCLAQEPQPDKLGLREYVGKGAPEAGPTDQPAASGTSQPAGQDGQDGPARPGSFMQKNGMFVVLIGGVILLYVWMGRSRRKQEGKRKEMLANLQKGDKVTSIGGVVGTVMEVRQDEVTVKVDETNNVRMKFARWAIRGVGDQAKTDPQAKK